MIPPKISIASLASIGFDSHTTPMPDTAQSTRPVTSKGCCGLVGDCYKVVKPMSCNWIALLWKSFIMSPSPKKMYPLEETSQLDLPDKDVMVLMKSFIKKLLAYK
eukprot:TRINITY_DN2919_c0_g1_i9.p2 TRINITY_DN2919_c0_g1~~TRINITY_DN2919_c0_g1_i9.p2  ORF type:complete len:105 (-),score=4.67 TRINITY_DN2919_c0_g1_i9:754-1068(-)